MDSSDKVFMSRFEEIEEGVKSLMFSLEKLVFAYDKLNKKIEELEIKIGSINLEHDELLETNFKLKEEIKKLS